MSTEKQLENLIPFTERTEKEQREIATMGGKASGESRRKRKQLREELTSLLETKDTQNRICVELIAKALDGDIKAFEVIRDTIGEKPKEQIEEKQDIKISMESDLGTWGK